MAYTETDTEIIDIVTMRILKARGAKTIYFNSELSDRIEVPLDTPLKCVYNKEKKEICIRILQ